MSRLIFKQDQECLLLLEKDSNVSSSVVCGKLGHIQAHCTINHQRLFRNEPPVVIRSGPTTDCHPTADLNGSLL